MKRLRGVIGCILVFAFMLLMFPVSVFAEDENVYPKEYSEDFKKISSDGKLVINAHRPTELEDPWGIFENFSLPVYFYRNYIYDDMHVEIDWMNFDSEEFNKGKLPVCLKEGLVPDEGNNIECHVLDVTFGGVDEDKLELVYSYASKIKMMIDWEDYDSLYVTSDLEMINFLASGYEFGRDVHNFIHFSNEFNEDIGYGNLNVGVQLGAGDPGVFRTAVFGEGIVMQDGAIYFHLGTIGSMAVNNIYVADDTKDADLMKVAQARIDEYLKGSKMEGKLVLKAGGDMTASNLAKLLAKEMEVTEEEARNFITHSCEYIPMQDPVCVYYSDEEFVEYLTYGELNVADEDKYDFDNKYYYIENTETGYSVPFLIVRDSDKMITNMNFKTADLDTNISIKANSSSIPSDTSVVVENKGDSLNEELGLVDGVSYDLKLYSITNNKKISDANGDKFTVSIPVTEDLATEDLVAYYIDENGKVHEYDVTVDGETASFDTDHFSTYTIGYKGAGNSEKVPETGDNLYQNLLISILSMFTLIGSSLYLKNN